MTWLLWRRQRVQAVCLLVWLAATLAVFASVGGPLNPARRPVGVLPVYFLLAMGNVPVLLGMFVGAPLFARELAAGTHRLVLTQGVTHRRWVAANLGLVLAVALGAAVIVGLAGALVLDDSLRFDAGLDGYGRWAEFDQQGPAIVAYVAFALALGIAAGALVGNTLPAMVITFLGNEVVRGVVSRIRPHYLQPLYLTQPTTAPVPSSYLVVDLQNSAGKYGVSTIVYQPAERFWTFQAIEAAIFAVLAALLVAFAIWCVRRRLT